MIGYKFCKLMIIIFFIYRICYKKLILKLYYNEMKMEVYIYIIELW